MKTTVLSLLLCWSLCGQGYLVSTVAGGGLTVNVPATSAAIAPSSVAVDAAGNIYFVSGNAVLRVDAATKTLTLVAGNATAGFGGDNGPATSARLNRPSAVAVDSAGNVYIADAYNYRIRKVANGIITTIAGNGIPGAGGDNGPAVNAQVNPQGLAVDSAGNLYVAGTVLTGSNSNGFFSIIVNSGSVREISGGTIATIAGNGTCCNPTSDGVAATNVPLYEPGAIAVDSAGNVYVASSSDLDYPGAVRKISHGVISTVAGSASGTALGDGGPATSALLSAIAGLAVDSAGNLFIADAANYRVREVSGGVISTVAGNGAFSFGGDNGPATGAGLVPGGLALDSAGNLYLSDTFNNRIREISHAVIATVAGNGLASFGGDNGPATSAQLYAPGGMALDSAGNLYIADIDNSRIREVTNGTIATVAGDGAYAFGGDNGPATAAGLFYPYDVAADAAGNLYIADRDDARVRMVSKGVITTVAGGGPASQNSNGDGGPATSALLGAPSYLAVDSAGNLYIGECGTTVRKVSNGIITTVAGNGTLGYGGDGGPATSAELNLACGIAVDPAGSLYIADSNNNRIRKVSNGIITTVVGSGMPGYSGDGGPATSAELYGPQYIAVDPAGNLYIADIGRIRKVSNGIVTTIAGIGAAGYSAENLPALSAQIAPGYLRADAAGDIYFSESGANRIRVLKPCGPLCAPLPPTPVVTAVVNGASFQPGIESGSWVTIQGANLANTKPGRTWNAGDFAGGTLPTQLDGVSVTIDGIAAFVEYISPTQINVQAPFDNTLRAVDVMVTNSAAASAPALAQLQAAAPAFFLYPETNYAVASRLPDYASVGNPSAPAKPGDTLVLWGTGFGPTNPTVPGGEVVTGAPAAVFAPAVTIGGMTVAVISTVLTAGSAGLYQITVQLPANVPTGAVALQASVGGVSTPAGVTILVGTP